MNTGIIMIFSIINITEFDITAWNAFDSWRLLRPQCIFLHLPQKSQMVRSVSDLTLWCHRSVLPLPLGAFTFSRPLRLWVLHVAAGGGFTAHTASPANDRRLRTGCSAQSVGLAVPCPSDSLLKKATFLMSIHIISVINTSWSNVNKF